jgi:hypothetical protein
MSEMPQDRRERVQDLLVECADDKLVRGQSGIAEQKAREALKLACDSPRLPSPWPQVAAYRLAHLLLRSASTNDKLCEADRYFKEAQGSDAGEGRGVLGPLPSLFRLATLHRLSQQPGPCRLATDFGKEQRAELGRAMAFIRRGWKYPSERVAQCDESKPDSPHHLQTAGFNLAEFAVYALGLDYTLDGVGSLPDLRPMRDSAWGVLENRTDGTPTDMGGVKLSREFALEELDSLGHQHPDAVLIRLSVAEEAERRLGRQQKPSKSLGQWRLGRQPEWTKANANSIKLLILLMKEPGTERIEVQHRVSIRGAAFRKCIQRTREGLKELTGRSNLVFQDEQGCLRLGDELPMFGAFAHGALLRR